MFNTSFGQFGVLTSQDILFYEPVVSMIKQNITNLVYPTAWKNELPLFSAIEFHSAFSEGMHVNLLAANLHIPSKGYFGSGLYWPIGVSINGSYVNNQVPEDQGALVVDTMTPFLIPPDDDSKLDSCMDRQMDRSHISADIHNARHLKITSPGKYVIRNSLHKKRKDNVHIKINGDVYNAIILREGDESVNVCHGRLCCSVSYKSGMPEGDLYAFAAFDGMHTAGRRYYLQACAFIRCANSSVESCGQPTTSSSGNMSKMGFSGNFSTPYVFPEVLTDQDGTPGLVTSIWYYMGSIIIDAGLNGGTLSISILGRDYSKD
jgi:pantetheine hydrolase